MPPRYAYWTIIAGGLPTAFRAAERDELLPTFRRLQQKHPDAVMKWFARGRLWETPEAAREELDMRRRSRMAPAAGKDWHRPGMAPRGPRRAAGPARDRQPRPADWRPGGEHRDPRQPFKDAKKARNQRWRAERFARKNKPGASGASTVRKPGAPATGRSPKPAPRSRRPSGDRNNRPRRP